MRLPRRLWCASEGMREGVGEWPADSRCVRSGLPNEQRASKQTAGFAARRGLRGKRACKHVRANRDGDPLSRPVPRMLPRFPAIFGGFSALLGPNPPRPASPKKTITISGFDNS